ncbi:Histidine kinase-, DNA gyrase B-, and HSP90-like ATPase [Pedococcus dokdonensis]|uniref:Histidine kinase-, DNA gyrase B-, and HSP90-like ATPase n=1 Tax=Pedococcus dokdonensis TaxID=443156 RepID=A0A1H0P7R0_9MICO|nr:Histidine kinase-, DNA gyrase B-, and HSP90-like ATPase [Pedococcus dokdonensis]
MAALFEDHQRPVAGGEIDTVRALLHDLRQPLAAILLLAGTEGGDVGRKMDGIAGQARWLAELVETSLSEAAADEVTTTDLGAIAQRAVVRARATAPCVITIDGVEGLEAWARPVALSRALACVLDNAVRAAGEGGHVRVGTYTDREGVHLTVTDDGPGLGKVSSRTSLGLTTTRAMVAACHGSFRLHAGAGGGAVADICLAQVQLRQVAS